MWNFMMSTLNRPIELLNFLFVVTLLLFVLNHREKSYSWRPDVKDNGMIFAEPAFIFVTCD